MSSVTVIVSCVCVQSVLAGGGMSHDAEWDEGMKANRRVLGGGRRRWRQKKRGLSWCRSGPLVAEEASCSPCMS